MKVAVDATNREYFERTGLYTPLQRESFHQCQRDKNEDSVKKKVHAKDSLTSSTSHELPYSTFVPKNLTEKSTQILD